jgi:hypothetical protein
VSAVSQGALVGRSPPSSQAKTPQRPTSDSSQYASFSRCIRVRHINGCFAPHTRTHHARVDSRLHHGVVAPGTHIGGRPGVLWQAHVSTCIHCGQPATGFMIRWQSGPPTGMRPWATALLATALLSRTCVLHSIASHGRADIKHQVCQLILFQSWTPDWLSELAGVLSALPLLLVAPFLRYG